MKQRRESRYFFSSMNLTQTLAAVRNVLGQECKHEFPVTETIYFTLGHEAGYAFPHGLRVRARRYIHAVTSSLTVENTPYFLEIKEEFQERDS